MLGRAGWPARLRGALIHTHTDNHTCGELEGSAFIVTTHLFYAFRQRFRLPTGSLTGCLTGTLAVLYSQSAGLGLGEGGYGDFGV